MFDGLHDIDWSAMHHAYGTAEEVPGLLAGCGRAAAPARAAVARVRVGPGAVRGRDLGDRRADRGSGRAGPAAAGVDEQPATGNDVVACLDRMGRAAAPALPQLRAQLDLPERGGRFTSIDNHEKLQRDCRTIIARLTGPALPH
ncbi:hypothetical protein [Catellatospora vulcania]|uniref:hypothetical protein n=1 Tax=Catellatospora vulcania TaxID=1460450 RepID=UPI0012D454E3|nr:hypothetical protein [Catellatospora vulcania]